MKITIETLDKEISLGEAARLLTYINEKHELIEQNTGVKISIYVSDR